jgi:hypothetical protein
MKTKSQPVEVSRRNFIRRAALGGLTALSATLLARRSTQACVNAGLCPGCPAYDDCNLPRALSRKQSTTKPANNNS